MFHLNAPSKRFIIHFKVLSGLNSKHNLMVIPKVHIPQIKYGKEKYLDRLECAHAQIAQPYTKVGTKGE